MQPIAAFFFFFFEALIDLKSNFDLTRDFYKSSNIFQSAEHFFRGKRFHYFQCCKSFFLYFDYIIRFSGKSLSKYHPQEVFVACLVYSLIAQV